MERNLMTFTKKKLATAIGGTLLASVGAQQALAAAVDIDPTASGLLYASEIVIGTSGRALPVTTDVTDVAGILSANGVSADTDIRVTLTLSSGTFTTTPTLAIVGDDAVSTTAASNTGCKTAGGVAQACAAPTLFTGGGTADSAVTFNTTTGTANVISNGHFYFDMGGVTVLDQSAVTATVDIQIADNFGPTDLPTNSGGYFSFAPVLALTADTTGVAEAIDVAQNSLFFATATGDNAITVGGALVTVSTNATLGTASIAIDATDIVGGSVHTITAPGGFSAFDQGTAVAGESIKIGGTVAVVSTADATLATPAAAIAVVATGDAAASRNVVLTAPTGNTVTIAETTLSDTVVTVTANANYSTATSSGTIALGSLTRNGSAARLTFSVNPDSAYPMSIRVTNDSAVVGPTTLTLTNDDGDTSASIAISAIAGGPAGELAVGASTALLSMADVFAAVQAADATFDLGATNKLRVDVTSLTPSIVLNAFSLSSDGTTFSMVTDAGA